VKTSDFDYELPAELIAQQPAARRDASRMLVVHRKTGVIKEHHFTDLDEFFSAGDVLAINNSKVIPARLFGKKATGASIEIFLLKKLSGGAWGALLKPAKRLKAGSVINLPAGGSLEILARCDEKRWLVRFSLTMPLDDFLEAYGHTPLPPYISRKSHNENQADDKERYQTIYAQTAGSVAAPTAGLHFSQETMAALAKKGVAIAPLTLHIGYGTFVPISVTDIDKHQMESEYFELPPATAQLINSATRVIAVGSTACRVLEANAKDGDLVAAGAGFTDLFIKPGYEFRVVDSLLTNFHLPRSTLFLLVCAFAGTELMLEAYQHAIATRFRFYSYGDCMLII
jgi:S-adenosylmethionine:tRNA ribosyltransferase-isomerase